MNRVGWNRIRSCLEDKPMLDLHERAPRKYLDNELCRVHVARRRKELTGDDMRWETVDTTPYVSVSCTRLDKRLLHWHLVNLNLYSKDRKISVIRAREKISCSHKFDGFWRGSLPLQPDGTCPTTHADEAKKKIMNKARRLRQWQKLPRSPASSASWSWSVKNLSIPEVSGCVMLM